MKLNSISEEEKNSYIYPGDELVVGRTTETYSIYENGAIGRKLNEEEMAKVIEFINSLSEEEDVEQSDAKEKKGS